MKKRSIIISLELIAIAMSLILIIFIDIKIVLSCLFIFLLALNYYLYKEKIGQELIVAVLFSLIITSYYIYEYTTANILIGRINIFPLIAWTAGLVFLREIYEKLKTGHKFLIISLVYIITLLLVEYLGFHILSIKLNSDFPSLLRLGIIHAPLGMKLFYICAGPIYIGITNYLKVK
ncbi:MAG: hypothetical protein Q7S27_02570 [Nanoarchaeota archaeon]|nr:hypothetical protein [Nanoarchaeota archaeon]